MRCSVLRLLLILMIMFSSSPAFSGVAEVGAQVSKVNLVAERDGVSHGYMLQGRLLRPTSPSFRYRSLHT